VLRERDGRRNRYRSCLSVPCAIPLSRSERSATCWGCSPGRGWPGDRVHPDDRGDSRRQHAVGVDLL